MLLATLILLGAPQATPPARPGAQWTETRFHRVHLANGRFIDGHLLKSGPVELILRIRSGEMLIRWDTVERVEHVTIRNVRENAVKVKPPAPEPPAPSDPRPSAVAVSAATPEIQERVDAIIARAKDAPDWQQALILEEVDQFGDEGAAVLAERLNRMPPKLLPLAGDLLGRLRSAPALPALRHHLHEGLISVKREAAEALARTAGAASIEDFLPLLKNPDEKLRALAIDGLEKAGASSALPQVAALAADTDSRVRAKAYALAFKWAEVEGLRDRLHDALVDALDSATGKPRAELVRALSAASPERGFEMVARALWDREKESRIAAVNALSESDPARAGDLILRRVEDESDPDVRIHLAVAVEKLKIEAAVPLLIGWLTDENSRVRRVSAGVLQSLTRRNFGEDEAAWKIWWQERRSQP